MQYLVISGEPKPDGLYHAVMQEIIRGAGDGGADVQVLTLDGIEGCRACNDGWGICRDESNCAFGKDGFDELRHAVSQADAWCLITPVDAGQPVAVTMHFLERLRRCAFGQLGSLVNKPLLVVSFPEGADNSLLTCLEHIDRFCRSTGTVIFDYLCVNTWNSDYMKVSAYAAGKVMAFGRKVGEAGTRRRPR